MSSVLVVQHQDDCPPALLGRWLSEEGAELDVRRPFAGDDLPDDLSEHAGLLVLGGSMGAHDDDRCPWLTPTKRLVRLAVGDSVPVLGLCLGHQLVAAALGGRSEPNPRGQQLGLIPVGWTAEAADDDLVRALTSATQVVQWNDDVVTTPPDGTVVLAQTAAGELQAARFAPRAWGIQAHPEVDAGILADWAAEESARYAEGQIEQVLAEIRATRERLEAEWRPLASSFLTLTRCQPVG